jgi:hypothetical protein
MNACCDVAGDRNVTTLVRRGRGFLAWVLPSAILVSVPKCPACLAAHVTDCLKGSGAFGLSKGVRSLCLRFLTPFH